MSAPIKRFYIHEARAHAALSKSTAEDGSDRYDLTWDGEEEPFLKCRTLAQMWVAFSALMEPSSELDEPQEPATVMYRLGADKDIDFDVVTFVTWKWKGQDPRRQFHSEYVNVLKAMLDRHYHDPFRLVCITDDSDGLDSAIEAFPLRETKADWLSSPLGSSASKMFPACYRRLWLFSDEALQIGSKLVNIDLDVIITNDITHLFRDKTANFVGWCDPRFAWSKIAGGLWMVEAGSHPEVWDDFDPNKSPQIAHESGHRGSDQAWMSYMLYPPRECWTSADGVTKIGWLNKAGQDPTSSGARIIFTIGLQPPWSEKMQVRHPWIRQHWRLE